MIWPGSGLFYYKKWRFHHKNIQRANFCDYFKPNNNLKHNQENRDSTSAKAQLAALFGDPVPTEEPKDENLSPAELAEKKLRELLNG